MSLVTQLLHIDPLIAAARKGDWPVVLSEVSTLINRYGGSHFADEFNKMLMMIMPVVEATMDPNRDQDALKAAVLNAVQNTHPSL